MDFITTARYHLLATQILFGAGYCLLVYDWIVCLGREWKWIWKMRMSSVKVLYLFCRYWPLITIPYILYAYTVPHTFDKCQHIFRIPVALATFNQLASESVLLARTSAFLGNKLWILLSLIACLSAVAAFQFYIVFKPMMLLPFIPGDTTGPCLTTGKWNPAFFWISVGFDSLVTILMMVKVFQMRRATGELSRSPLVQLFVSEGLWYFVLVAAANIINGIFYYQPIVTLSAIAVPFSNMLPVLLACRLILDLRRQGAKENVSWVSTSHAIIGYAVPGIVVSNSTKRKPAPVLSSIRFDPPSHDRSAGAYPSGGTVENVVSFHARQSLDSDLGDVSKTRYGVRSTSTSSNVGRHVQESSEELDLKEIHVGDQQKATIVVTGEDLSAFGYGEDHELRPYAREELAGDSFVTLSSIASVKHSKS